MVKRCTKFNVPFIRHHMIVLLGLCILSVNLCCSHTTTIPLTKPSDTITVLSYNVENLFDCVDNGTEFSDYASNTSNWSYEMFQRKMDNCASVIAASKADICVLCEVENANAGRQLQKTLHMKGIRYTYFAAGDNPNAATTCQVILSKLPITMSRGHGVPKKGEHYTRNILEADIDFRGHILKLFAVHLPSKRYPESFRIAASDVLAQRIKQLPLNTEYVIAGDFNSNYDEAESFFTERLDNTHGRTAINHVFKTVTSRPGEPLNFVTKQELMEIQGDGTHYDPWLELPDSRRFSYIYRGQKQTLDHVLVPGTLFDSVGISYVDRSFDIVTWHGRLLYDGVPYRWQTRFDKSGRKHLGEGYSDHLPVLAKFVIGSFRLNEPHTDSSALKSIARDTVIDGFGGWVGCDNNFRLTAWGSSCLYIDGLSPKSAKVAHVRLPVVQGDSQILKRFQTLSLKVKGTGSFVIMFRWGDGQWMSYNPVTGRIGKSYRYTLFQSPEWQKVTLPLTLPVLSGEDALELQIRSKGGEALRLWIGEVKIE